MVLRRIHLRELLLFGLTPRIIYKEQTELDLKSGLAVQVAADCEGEERLFSTTEC